MRALLFISLTLFFFACEDDSDGINVDGNGNGNGDTTDVDNSLIVFRGGDSGTPEELFSKSNYVFADSKGMVWLGTFREGLLKYDPTNKTTERFDTKEITGDDDFGGTPYAMAEGEDGKIYIGDSGGLLVYDGNELKTHSSQFGTTGIHTINKLEDGKIYFGTYNEQFGIIGRSGELEANYSLPDDSGPIKDIALDNDGNIWLAGRFTLAMFDGNDYTLYDTEAITGEKPQSAEDEIYMNTIAKDENGNLWFGDWEGFNKTYYWNGSEFVKGYDYNEDGVTNRIREHYFHNGDYWVAGNNGGIIRYNNGNIVKEWNEDNSNLPDNDVYSLYFKDNRVYFGTRNGWGYIVLDN